MAMSSFLLCFPLLVLALKDVWAEKAKAKATATAVAEEEASLLQIRSKRAFFARLRG